MFTVALQVLGRPELAADAVQQASCRPGGRAVIHGGIRHRAVAVHHHPACGHRRLAKGAPARGRRPPEDLADPATDEPSLERSWEAWQIRKALDELPVDERAVVRLAYVEGLTHSETADRLGIPIGTVKSRTYRAYRRSANYWHISLRITMKAEVSGSMDSDERPPALPDRLLAILRQEELWVDPPADLEDRTLAALRAELDASPATTVDEIAVARERRSRRRRWAPMLVAAAAAVAVGVVATAAVMGTTSRSPQS